MKRLIFGIFISLLFCETGICQNEVKYSSVNPALFLYNAEDVFVRPPEKHNNGANIIRPNPQSYPWEARLENGMPNVIRDSLGNLSIYISSFVAFASSPPSKVGVMVYTNNTDNVNSWNRPNAGLYWYNPNGATADQKISPINGTGFIPTNIVAVDIESFGMFDDYQTNYKPIKLVYLPQRESGNKIVSAYEMERQFNSLGILEGFSQMKSDRITSQINFEFPFINADTHMNYLKQEGIYYFVSRLNSKRSALKSGETLPFSPDPRKRYRRETVTEIGSQLESKKVSFDIALDMSTAQWEPYSMQPLRMPGHEHDIWWGLVTMFGTEGDEEVQHKQRTELAISNDGKIWQYLKPGTPFLDNGLDPNSDDYGCINIAKPIANTKYSTDSTNLYYFYAASNVRHVSGRNPGISLAIGKAGKLAGLKAGPSEKSYFSLISDSVSFMPKLSMYDAFLAGGEFFPYILSDVTEDPRGKMLTEMDSYASVIVYAYDSAMPNGLGAFLCGSLGSPKVGTTAISDNYECVPFTREQRDGTSKYFLLKYLKQFSDAHPEEIISISEMEPIPIVLEARMKNSTFYGVKFNKSSLSQEAAISIDATSSYYPSQKPWVYSSSTAGEVCTFDFSLQKRVPNNKLPINRESGTIAISATFSSASTLPQTLLKMYGDNERDDLGIYYDPNGNIRYTLNRDGAPFAEIVIPPPVGKSFAGHNVIITLEAVDYGKRKHGKYLLEDSDILRVYCPELGLDYILQQEILWSWRHAQSAITEADKANARAFAYLTFSAFSPSMSKLTIGGDRESTSNPFTGIIHKVEIADELSSGISDFWTE